MLLVFVRLFYWMIIRGPALADRAQSQRDVNLSLPANRGDILASDGSPLVSSQETFLLYAYKPLIEVPESQIVDQLVPIIGSVSQEATTSAVLLTPEEELIKTKEFLQNRMNLDRSWIVIKHYLSREQKQKIQDLNIKGLGFEEEKIRYYPEGSMSAQLLGFVGNDINGEPQGYFGLEGFYNRQLQGRSGKLLQENDATGMPILLGDFKFFSSQDGRTLKTTINRAYQYYIEKMLDAALLKYGAKSGSVVVLEPQTGAVLAMASSPHYDPARFYLYPQDLLKNPVVADLFEPGSVFKPLVMAAAINEKLVEPETTCDICSRPVQIGTYTIRTWNDKYTENSTMTQTLINSDNTGMVFAARKLQAEKLREYLEKFGMGKNTGIDLQEEVDGHLRPAKDWREIDLATISFGQGIAITPIQLVTAINVLANKGKLVMPHIVSSISDGDKDIPTRLSPSQTVVTEDTAFALTQMMIQTVENGDARWARPKGIQVAGKTGTAQIPIQGHYDEEKTIASFVGFAPAENPKFTMLVTLREPTSSPWGSETAAPLWFNIAKFLLLSH